MTEVMTDPQKLEANANKSFQGSILLGMGFTFDDKDRNTVATPIAEMKRPDRERPAQPGCNLPLHRREGGEQQPYSCTSSLCHQLPGTGHCVGTIWRAIDGREAGRRILGKSGYVTELCRLIIPNRWRPDWPDLLKIVEERVNPQRDVLLSRNAINQATKSRWWRFHAYRQGLNAAIVDLDQVLTISRVGQHAAVRIPAERHGLRGFDCRLPSLQPRSLLCAAIPPARNLGALLRLIHERRPLLHSL